jgi:hypothetical protein
MVPPTTGRVTFAAVSGDTTAPVTQVRAPSSVTEESVRESGVPVDVRSNEVSRVSAELIARGGARRAALTRDLRFAGREYPLRLRLSRAGLRALEVFDAYTLRIRVSDHAGNRRTVQRRVVIR